jgi:hypothetical protein
MMWMRAASKAIIMIRVGRAVLQHESARTLDSMPLLMSSRCCTGCVDESFMSYSLDCLCE